MVNWSAKSTKLCENCGTMMQTIPAKTENRSKYERMTATAEQGNRFPFVIFFKKPSNRRTGVCSTNVMTAPMMTGRSVLRSMPIQVETVSSRMRRNATSNKMTPLKIIVRANGVLMLLRFRFGIDASPPFLWGRIVCSEYRQADGYPTTCFATSTVSFASFA